MSLFRRAGCILLAFAFLLPLSACTRQEQADITPEEPSPELEDVYDGNGFYVSTFGDQKFSLSYAPDDSLDPFTSETTTNEILAALMFEGLFRTDSNFQTQKVFCQGYTVSEDKTQYTFSLISGVTFHDGSPMTAADVKYSIERAMAMPKYSYRLSGVTSVEAVGDGTVTVTLSAPSSTLPVLLDIPVIRSGSGDQTVPPGTGPYCFLSDALQKYSGYRSDLSSLPDRIELKEDAPQTELAADFSSGTQDLLLYDLTAGIKPTIHIGCEKRSFTSTVLQFIGFQTDSGPFADAALRSAVYAMIDKDYLTDTVMSGCVSQARGFLPDEVGYCREGWNPDVQANLRTVSAKLTELGMTDTNHDGILELYGGDCHVRFIVSDSNRYVLNAAKRISVWLTDNGLDVELSILSFEEYQKALSEGKYDMYYGQVRLAPDFDLTPLIGTDGSLNLSGYSDESTDSLLSRFLTADGAGKADAAEALLIHLRQAAPIVPIAYNRYSIYTHVGEISGLDPSVSGIFQNAQTLSITPQ